MEKKRSYIFDIGRVLADFEFDEATKKLEEASAWESEMLREKLFGGEGSRLQNEYELGNVATPDFYREMKELLALDMDYDKFREVWSDIFTENVRMESFLDAIKERPKIILSNTCEMHWGRVSSYGVIKRHFAPDAVVKSFEVRLRKPDSAIFELAKRLLPMESEIVYFDDLEANVEAARALGIRGIRYDCRFDDIDMVLKQNGLS